MRKAIAFFLIIIGCLSFSSLAEAKTRKGLWITCIGESRPLSSREGVEKAVEFAAAHGFDTLFVQVYRGDEAWFRSRVADDGPFRKNRAAANTDTFALLIRQAHAAGLEVHAWINTLTLSQNDDAKILETEGRSILTRDQHKRHALKVGWKDPLERYYLKEDQLFLEPGDWRVKARIKAVARELAANYPDLDGIHFDYIRYPAAPPYIPGSRFNPVGLSYGYGPANVKLFHKKHPEADFDPHEVDWKRDESQIWDDWKRGRVTALLKEAAAEARSVRPDIKISCAVLAAFDRAYLAAYQDWPRWLEEGPVDFVVLMNYSTDSRFVRHASRAALGLARSPDQIHVGLGAFLMADRPKVLADQYRRHRELGAGGVVFFDYDALLGSPELAASLKE